MKTINMFLKRNKNIIMFFLLVSALFIVPDAIAQGGLKIQSLAEVQSTAEDGANTILEVAKYVLAAVLAVALIFVIYALATNNPHAKDYLLGWIIAVVVIMIAFLII
jgi:hypothetical protein